MLQCDLKHKATTGGRPITESLLEQGLIVPCIRPCSTPVLPFKELNGKGYLSVQAFRAINRVVIPGFLSNK